MTLVSGLKLGLYEVLSPLGAGGMGEVYRARDTKLGRDVALNVLPAAFAADPERMARFKREALVLASLNHPHIGTIYGFEDSSSVHALVMDFIEGSTLADRIAGGPIPGDEALPIAKEIAEALAVIPEASVMGDFMSPKRFPNIGSAPS
jgi:serine/threonine protein kinase